MYVGLYSSGGEGRASGEVLCMWDSIPVEVRVGLVERYYSKQTYTLSVVFVQVMSPYQVE